MKMCDINPHIRYAETITFSLKEREVKCTDCRLMYVVSGEGEIEINNQTFKLHPDSFFYSCGGTVYTLKAKEPLIMISLNFDLTQKHNLLTNPFLPVDTDSEKIKSMPVFFDEIEDSEILSSYTIVSNASYMSRKLKSILSEFLEHKIFFREVCNAKLKEILILIHRNDLNKSSTINEVIAYIHENFQNEITNKELAEIAGYHEFHLNKLFINHTGTTMHNYILNLRINEAKRLILNTKLSFAEIALQTGFNNYTYFCSYFKKIVGLTPFQYKKELRNKA